MRRRRNDESLGEKKKEGGEEEKINVTARTLRENKFRGNASEGSTARERESRGRGRSFHGEK